MAHLERLVPPRFQPTTGTLIHQISDVLSTYVRSQLLIGFVMGALYAVGFATLRVPLAVTLGLLSGLLNFIPYLGTLIGFVLSIAFLALDGAGFARISGALIVFAIVQSVEGYYLTPKLLGNKLNLHPLWVIIGLVIGGNLFGLIGIILAVPFIAIAQVLLGFLEQIYQESQFYRRPNTKLLTESGNPVSLTGSFNTPLATESLITSPAISGKAPRMIITTSEIESRLRDSAETNDSPENL
jgi:predicted PurR-regulated permease PerM